MSATLTYIRLNLGRILLLIGAISALATYYLAIPQVDAIFNEFNTWTMNINSFMLFTGVITVGMRYVRGVTKRDSDVWPFQLYALIYIIVWVILGETSGMYSTFYQKAFLSTKIALHIAIIGQIIFFICSAGYRTLRINNARTALLAGCALLMVIANAPWMAGYPVISQTLAYWLLDNPQMAASRAVIISGGVGAVIVGIRILLGLEKSALRATEGQ